MIAAWGALVVAIAGEVFGTFSLKAVSACGSAWWYIGTVAGYALAFALLMVALRELPIGVTYAVWSGVGIIGAMAVGRLIFGESTGWPQYAGAAAVIGGVALMTLARQGAC
jgi:small multidrug resistance pump